MVLLKILSYPPSLLYRSGPQFDLTVADVKNSTAPSARKLIPESPCRVEHVGVLRSLAEGEQRQRRPRVETLADVRPIMEVDDELGVACTLAPTLRG